MNMQAERSAITELAALLRDIPDHARRLIIALSMLSALLLAATPQYVQWIAWTQAESVSAQSVKVGQSIAQMTAPNTTDTHTNSGAGTGVKPDTLHFVLGLDENGLRLAPTQVARPSSLVQPRWLGEPKGATYASRSTSRCGWPTKMNCSAWVLHHDEVTADMPDPAMSDFAVPQEAHVYRFAKTPSLNMELTWLPWVVVEIVCGLCLLAHGYQHAPRVKDAVRMSGKSLRLLNAKPEMRHERSG